MANRNIIHIKNIYTYIYIFILISVYNTTFIPLTCKLLESWSGPSRRGCRPPCGGCRSRSRTGKSRTRPREQCVRLSGQLQDGPAGALPPRPPPPVQGQSATHKLVYLTTSALTTASTITITDAPTSTTITTTRTATTANIITTTITTILQYPPHSYCHCFIFSYTNTFITTSTPET